MQPNYPSNYTTTGFHIGYPNQQAQYFNTGPQYQIKQPYQPGGHPQYSSSYPLQQHVSYQPHPVFDAKKQQIYTEGENNQILVSSVNFKALNSQLTKKEQLDERVALALSQLAEEVVDDVVELACKLAKHRGSKTLSRGDIRFAFEKRYKQKIPNKVSADKDQSVSILPQPIVSTANYKNALQLVKKEVEKNAAQ